MRPIIVLSFVVAICFSSACVRKKEEPKSAPSPPPQTGTIKPTPLADHDLTGRKRATPRATMGALEADPAQPPPRRPPKNAGDRAPKKDVDR